MPLIPIAELIFQPIAELVLQVIGYFTARVIVPICSFGFVHVEPGPHKEVVVPKFGRVQRHSGKLIMDAELGALIGIIFWLVIVVGSFAVTTIPNMAVKGTRRPDAILKVCFLIEFGGFAKRSLAARPLPLR